MKWTVRLWATLALSVGSMVPAANLPADPLGLAQFRGKVVYLDFWASWCVPCRESFPWMSSLQRKFAADGLVVISVNLDAERSEADRFLARYPASFPVKFDPQGAVAEQFEVQNMPTSFLVDRAGKMQARHAGFRLKDREALEQQIRALLAVPLTAPPTTHK